MDLKNKLAKKLLDKKGIAVRKFTAADFYISKLIKSGKFYDSEDYGVIFTEGKVRLCHKQSCILADELLITEQQKDTHMMNGFALDMNGVWMPHSFVISEKVIHETTPVDWDLYYAIELSRNEYINMMFDGETGVQ